MVVCWSPIKGAYKVGWSYGAAEPGAYSGAASHAERSGGERAFAKGLRASWAMPSLGGNRGRRFKYPDPK